MSRTFRNRHSVPKGWVVRDDGHIYYKNGIRSQAERRHLHREAARESRWRGYPWWAAGHMFFRWWEDPDCPEFRGYYTRQERKDERKLHYRSYRAKMKNLIRQERWDDCWPYRKTEGWLTW